MEKNPAQDLMWLIRHSQKQGFVAGAIVTLVATAAMNVMKTHSITVRKKSNKPIV